MVLIEVDTIANDTLAFTEHGRTMTELRYVEIGIIPPSCAMHCIIITDNTRRTNKKCHLGIGIIAQRVAPKGIATVDQFDRIFEENLLHLTKIVTDTTSKCILRTYNSAMIQIPGLITGHVVVQGLGGDRHLSVF